MGFTEILLTAIGLVTSIVLPAAFFIKKLLKNQEDMMDKIAGNGKDDIGLVGRVTKLREEMTIVSRQVDELHEWHDVTDSEGVKIWYVRQSLEQAITSLSTAITEMNRLNAEQTQVLNHLVDLTRERVRDNR